MSSTLEQSKKGKALRVLDPDLPFLASEAAIDIDNLLSKGSKDLTTVHRLAEQLKNSIDSGAKAGTPRSLMDPATLTVVSTAVLEASENFIAGKIVDDDILSKAKRIAEILSCNELPLEPDNLLQARDFCVALSKAAIAYNKSILDLRPSHPFRR